MLKRSTHQLRHSKRLSQFLILWSFLGTFIVVRVITHLQKFNFLPSQHSSIFHIHHLVPGIILLLLSGYIGISFWSISKLRLIMAVSFGIGAALTIDEFALWLYLRDVYWERQGRDSVDAVIFVILIISIVLLLSEVHDHKWIKQLFKKA